VAVIQHEYFKRMVDYNCEEQRIRHKDNRGGGRRPARRISPVNTT